MIAKAQTKYLRISPLKTRQVIELIKGKPVPQALAILEFLNKKPAYFLKKILQSAINNAKNKGFGVNQVYISNLIASNGPSWKRFRAASFGRAAPILKRTTHVKIVLDLIPEAIAEKKNPKSKVNKKMEKAVA